MAFLEGIAGYAERKGGKKRKNGLMTDLGYIGREQLKKRMLPNKHPLFSKSTFPSIQHNAGKPFAYLFASVSGGKLHNALQGFFLRLQEAVSARHFIQDLRLHPRLFQ